VKEFDQDINPKIKLLEEASAKLGGDIIKTIVISILSLSFTFRLIDI